jgi:hypothetical protein
MEYGASRETRAMVAATYLFTIKALLSVAEFPSAVQQWAVLLRWVVLMLP